MGNFTFLRYSRDPPFQDTEPGLFQSKLGKQNLSNMIITMFDSQALSTGLYLAQFSESSMQNCKKYT